MRHGTCRREETLLLSGLLVGLSALAVVLLCGMVVGGVAALLRELGRTAASLGEVRRLEQLWAMDAVQPHDRWRG